MITNTQLQCSWQNVCTSSDLQQSTRDRGDDDTVLHKSALTMMGLRGMAGDTLFLDDVALVALPPLHARVIQATLIRLSGPNRKSKRSLKGDAMKGQGRG